MSSFNDFETGPDHGPTNSVNWTRVDVAILFAKPARKEWS